MSLTKNMVIWLTIQQNKKQSSLVLLQKLDVGVTRASNTGIPNTGIPP